MTPPRFSLLVMRNVGGNLLYVSPELHSQRGGGAPEEQPKR
jgi:hypothetical protein